MTQPDLSVPTIQRTELMLSIIPKEVESVLDVGNRTRELSAHFRRYVNISIEGEYDMHQDLMEDTQLKFKDDEFDIVILSQILEHLVYFEPVIKEAIRVSKKWILLGLPNDFTYDARFRYFFHKCRLYFDYPFGHKYLFDVKLVEDFVKIYFGDYEKRIFTFASSGARFLPKFIKRFLSNIYPNLFAMEIYYLIGIP